MTNKSGIFITFEGIEGSGKSTQIKCVYDWLCVEGIDCIKTREPGGTAIGNHLRNLMLDPQSEFSHHHTEVFLFMADRLEHIEGVVKPALAAGKVVLCDRYLDSTIAYQAGGRQIDPKLIASLHQWIDLMPIRTILLDCKPEQGLQRAIQRARLDRFEKENIDFHQRIYDRYMLAAKENPERIKTVKAENRSIDSIFTDIQLQLQDLIDSIKE